MKIVFDYFPPSRLSGDPAVCVVIVHQCALWLALVGAPWKYLSGVMDSVIRLFCWVKFNMYKFVRGSLVPFMMTFPVYLFRMRTDLSLKVDSHPWSQNVPMYSRALLIPGKICAFRAWIGRSWWDRIDVCVDMMISLFGIWMRSGWTSCCLLSHGKSRVS